MTMPEEVNRRVTDAISDLLLTPSLDGNENLLREGVAEERIRFVGNVMIDTLVRMLPKIVECDVVQRLALTPGQYVLVTLHRPSNVDDPATLKEVIEGLRRVSEKVPIVFPVHPRTRLRIAESGLQVEASRIQFVDPVGYVECLALERSARMVITDSGGVQEETTYLKVPCLTVRPNTERPVTITHGTNQLVKSTADSIVKAANSVLSGTTAKASEGPKYWDGQAAVRIVDSWKEVAKY
jgi:UDP-N-acetylglucosamine 2-epimerase (non-hydrolysing)